MPYIHIQTNRPIDKKQRETLTAALGKAVTVLGKSESWLMLRFEGDCDMALSRRLSWAYPCTDRDARWSVSQGKYAAALRITLGSTRGTPMSVMSAHRTGAGTGAIFDENGTHHRREPRDRRRGGGAFRFQGLAALYLCPKHATDGGRRTRRSVHSL